MNAMPQESNSFRPATSAASFSILILALLFAPIFKAGMMPGAFFAMSLSMLLVLILSVFSTNNSSEYSNSESDWFMVWCVFALSLCAHLFLIPYVRGGEHFFSHNISSDVVQNLGLKSLVPNRLRVLNVWVFFTCMWIVAWRISSLSRQQIQHLILVVFIASLFQAVYGLFHLLSGEISVLGLWDKQYTLKDATGTFVNRNHYSGMLAICWPIVLGGLINKKPLLFCYMPNAIRSSIAITYSLIVAIAIASSNSRMGFAAAFFGIIVWGVGWYRSHFDGAALVSRRLMLLIIFGSVFFFLIWFGIEEVLERYMELDDGNSRLTIWASMFQLPISTWVLGIGPGAFEDVFHLVQPQYLNVRFVYAHNDYLEFVLEFGFVLSAIFLLTVLYWFRKIYPKGGHGLRAGVIGGVAAVAMHSLVDFNLQIPGSAIFFWVAIGLIMNPNMAEHSDVSDFEKSPVEAAVSPKNHIGFKKKRSKKSNKMPKTRKEWLSFFRSN